MTSIDIGHLEIVSGGMPTVAQLAYRNWEDAGRPMGRSGEFWQKAEWESRFRPSCPCLDCCRRDVWWDPHNRMTYRDPYQKPHDLDPRL